MRSAHDRLVATLLGTPLEPPHLVLVNAALGATGVANGVEKDEPDGGCVGDVVQVPVLTIAPRDVDELTPRERAAVWVRGYRHGGAGHERLPPGHENLHLGIGIQASRDTDRIEKTDH